MKRDDLIQEAVKAIKSVEHISVSSVAEAEQNYARAVVDAVLPQITHERQLLGVPELSLLTTETRPVATIYEWRDGKLYEDTDSKDYGFLPGLVLAGEGPLTVVWTP